MDVFGHRGVAGHCAENSLASIRKALSMELDGIEFDVRVTRDQIPVVIHDATIDRTTSASGHVHDFTAQELRQLLARQQESIPTLREVLQEIGTATRINVELKELEACAATLRVLRASVECGLILAEDVLVSSFDLDAVGQFRDLAAEFSVGLLTQDPPDDSFWRLAVRLQARSVNISIESVTAPLVEIAHQNGLEVMVFTVNSLVEAQRMKQLGVDAIFSDFPDRVRT